ncbi:MAG: hydroxymethylglutaryl-CoA lyase [Acidimicrobiaceae bacterium]
MPERTVQLVEVSPRDGLQAESVVLSTAAKVELIERIVAAGARRVEVCSFVNPARVPQMADAEAVLAALPQRDDVTYIGLVLNRRGFDRAAAAGIREINVVAVATDTFGQRNQGATSDETVATFEAIAGLAIAAGIAPTLTISTAFGCPYEGAVRVDRVVDIAKRAVAAGATEVAIADTIGVAVPTDVTERVAAVRSVLEPGVGLRAHFHNTRNTGIANAYAAYEAGVEAIDASLGGIGGCPFAPNATGNVPTEDVAYLFERMGVDTGLDLAKLIETVPWIEAQLGSRVPGLLAKAGLFP